MKRILFIDRDGVILQEPPIDFQIDRLDKTSFVKGAITALSKIADELDY
jgi:imidazoleglycerol-phosphate dehydratase/histidinol-phosphatase